MRAVTSEPIAGAGSGDADADAWSARLGWAFGLIADDPVERAAALTHLDEARRNASDALARSNDLWWLTRPLGPEAQYREPAYRRAREVYYDVCSRSLPEGLSNRPYGADVKGWPGLPYALVYLEWEARFPREWTEHAKASDPGQLERRTSSLIDQHSGHTRASATPTPTPWPAVRTSPSSAKLPRPSIDEWSSAQRAGRSFVPAACPPRTRRVPVARVAQGEQRGISGTDSVPEQTYDHQGPRADTSLSSKPVLRYPVARGVTGSLSRTARGSLTHSFVSWGTSTLNR